MHIKWAKVIVVFFSPPQRLLEDYVPPARVDVIDEHQGLLRVAVDSVTRAERHHGETSRRFPQKLPDFCHLHLAVGHSVCFHGLTQFCSS